MNAALVLIVFAVLAATLGARLLAAAQWPLRSPAWGIWAWQALSVSVAAAVVLAGAVIALPETPMGDVVATVLRACSDALAAHYATPGGLPVALLAGGLSVLVVVRFLTIVVGDARGVSSRRRAQRDVLTLVGAQDSRGFTVVEHESPLVYCLPGGSGTLVVTSAAKEALTARQLDLVLAHERLHIQAHHHAALALSSALSRTFGRVGVFSVAHERIAALVEMQADDAVNPTPDRHDLARALLNLTPRDLSPGAALAASSHGRAVQRVRRLTEAEARPGRRVALLASAAGLATLAAPLALALVPAFEAAARDCCPTALSHLPDAPTDSSRDDAARPSR